MLNRVRWLLIAITTLIALGSNSTYADEAVKLVPPTTSTKETRTRDMLNCLGVSQEIEKYAPEISSFEKAPLLGQNTGRFLGGKRPAANEDAIPVRYSSAIGINWGQSVASDRYVLCLLALGYKWPSSITPIPPASADMLPERESNLLYNAGQAYRRHEVLTEAERLLRRSLELEEKVSGPDSVKTIRRLAELAALYLQLERHDEGLPFAKRLMPVAANYSRPERQFLLSIFDSYGKELRKRHRDAEASLFEAKAAELH